MKKIILLAAAGCVFAFCHGQNSVEIELKNLVVPSSPAFTLLDFHPKTIERPGTIKALALNVVNQVSNSEGIPKNFALEFSPYWFFRHKDMNIHKYNGIKKTSEDGKTVEKQNIFAGLRSVSISAGSVFKDSSKTTPVDINYLAYGIRANIITIKSKKVLNQIAAKTIDINSKLSGLLEKVTCADTNLTGPARLQCLAEGMVLALKNDAGIKELRAQYTSLLSIRPLFTVDAAFSSSTMFGDNSFSNSKTYRTGAWLTLAFCKPIAKDQELETLLETKNYFNAYVMLRALSENATKDFVSFNKQRFFDAGGRIEFELDKFACSFETIRRINRTDESLNSSRTVGIIQYRLGESLYLLGTFGKDFEKVNNLIAILGVNFGFGSNAVFEKFR